ncbi:NfeD family protein [Ruminococcus sp. M6(2020)]|uniref:NfeD family protein n=2 Tax=Ruminococcus difficilis TaxID=2763069 RepID=A0A935C6T2_9FIRM|nr:NfeD family protein [Ruminococcus difficilis]
MTIIWLVIAVVMGVTEACTVQLVSVWFAIGSAAACITSLFTDQIYIQVIVFVVVTAIALAVTRPLVKKLKRKRPEATNADRYIGKSAVVVEAIDNDHAKGLVKVDNEKWTARSADGQLIEPGDRVVVTAIEGVKLIVSKV